MIVFKNYFKIAKAFLPMILIYVIVFSFFGVMASSTGSNSASFMESKPSIALINLDENNDFIKHFRSYLEKKMTLKTISTEKKDIQDALFYREVDAVITIPKGFSATFFQNEIRKLGIQKVPDSEAGAYIEMLINKYLDTAHAYVTMQMSPEKVISYTDKDLQKEVKVSLQTKKQGHLESATIFYNFSNYTILGIVVLVVSTIMGTYQKTYIKKRSLMGTISYRKMNLALFLGNTVLTLAIWFFYSILTICLYGKSMLSMEGFLLMGNQLIFSLTALAIGFCLGHLVQNKEAQSGIVNVIALGSSFVCGAFVPQEYLGNFVLHLGRIFPSYYYVSNNNMIATFASSDWPAVCLNMGIMILYIIAIFGITNLVTRCKRKEA